jgi:hypothetical protein
VSHSISLKPRPECGAFFFADRSALHRAASRRHPMAATGDVEVARLWWDQIFRIAQHHHAVARGTKQIVVFLVNFTVLAVVESKFVPPFGQVHCSLLARIRVAARQVITTPQPVDIRGDSPSYASTNR